MRSFHNILFILLMALSVPSAAQTDIIDSMHTRLQQTKTLNQKKAAEAQIRYFIIKADSAQFGYSVYVNGNLFIQQSIIPSLPGKKGFTDTLSAGKVARLVIQKIRDGEMPPTITTTDLKRSGVQ